MEHWRSVAVAIVAAMIAGIGFWAYRGIELIEGKAAFAAGNVTVAARKLRPLSGWGDPVAEAELGAMYAKGLGLPEDDGKALVLLTKAANTGMAYPEALLGDMYWDGKGAPPDRTLAVFWFRQAAAQGNLAAETALGEAYARGQGVAQDYAQAATWFQQAAYHGDAEAEDGLGRLYLTGLGAPQDAAQAAALFQQSAAQGNVDAQVELGICYHQGNGVAQDDVRAAGLFGPAAAAGNRVAEYYLGLAYETGEGVAADPVRAEALWRRAAVQGDADAQLALGRMLETAAPAMRDAVLAYVLYDRAAGQGDGDAKAARDGLAVDLTPEQLDDARRLAGQWTAGAALPATSIADRAPQVLFAPDAKQAVYQASRTWFSRGFALAGQNWDVVFVATAGKPCAACGARIGAATFRLDGSNGIAAVLAAPGFTMFGAGGEAPAEAAAAATVAAFGADNAAILVPNAAGQEIFSFRLTAAGDLDSGRWTDAGRIAAGPVSVVAVAGSDWPEIEVNPGGAGLDALYRFDGKRYVLMTQQAAKGL